HVRAGHGDIEVHPAALDLGDQILAAGLHRAGLQRPGLHIVGAEGHHALALADALGQRHAPAQGLIGLLGVDRQQHRNLDRLVELRRLELLQRCDRAGRLHRLFGADIFIGAATFAQLRHAQPSTVMPIDRAVPSITFMAASMFRELRSSIFSSAILRTWSRLIVPTLFLFGSPEPFSTPAASLISTAAGELFPSNVNERSLKTVTITPTTFPLSWAVAALNCWMNCPGFTPLAPSTGPSGGAGVADPPGAMSLNWSII